MPILPVNPENIAEAARLLGQGQLVAFPTETVYGLGADATNGTAVARIFEAKGRPHFNPLIVHVVDLAAAERLGEFSSTARRLAHAFWPGPLTMVVKRRLDCPISDLATAGLDTLAIRVPSHPVARELIAASGLPIAAPSANRSGHVSATRAQHVATDFGDRVSLVLDGGAAEHGVESTVLDVSGAVPCLLRPGAVTREALVAVVGEPIHSSLDGGDRPTSPGQLASHYAPGVPVRLEAIDVRAGEALLAFGPDVPAHAGAMINLSARGDIREAAANLFAALRALDRPGVTGIAVMPIPAEGLGAAINDRLQRAAAPR